MRASDNKKSRTGLVALIVASLLLAANLLTELVFVSELRDMPSFFQKPSITDSGLSLTMGLATVVDVIFIATTGLGILIYAIKIRRYLPAHRFRVIAIVTVLQLIILPGATSMTTAHFLGPSKVGAQALKNWDASGKTIKLIGGGLLPAGFAKQGSVDEQEQVNARFVAQSSPQDQPEFGKICSNVIAYAKQLGATAWLDKTSNTKGLLTDESKTQDGCLDAIQGYPKLKVQVNTVVSPEFILAGQFKGSGDTNGVPIALSLQLLKQGTAGDHPNTWIYELQIATAFGGDPLALTGGLSKGTVEINDLLQLIGQERLAAPDRNPTEPAFVKEILKSYKHKIAIRVFETKPGVANRLDLTNSDGVHLCLAIDPWDAKREGIEDPGYGYGLGFMDNLKVLHGFGVAVEGGCSK